MKKLITLLTFAFCLNANAQYTKTFSFSGTTSGNYPFGSFVSDGTFLYGMTHDGGANNKGTIFKIMPNGTGYVKLLDFAGVTNGSGPNASLIYDGTFLYGTTEGGGANGDGTIFKIMPNGTGYVDLLDFAGTTNGSYPKGSLLYDGTYLYGMTSSGGANNKGTIFKIMPNGTGYSKLFDFAGANGSSPFGSLISDGNFLYGMTFNGGANSMGNVFKIMPDGTGFVNLLDFAGANGYNPNGDLYYDGTFLYGITQWGGIGTGSGCTSGCGVIFKIKTDGTGYVKLLDFFATANGSTPYGSLISDGTFLYGMTTFGGSGTYCSTGCGVIFKIMPNGTGFSKLRNFAGPTTDGQYPYGSLFSAGGCMYGMTNSGGSNYYGAIFSLCGAMGVQQLENDKDQVIIYPSPTSDQFFIDANTTDNLNVNLYDATGRYVFNKSIDNKSNIDVTNLNEGIYFLIIKTADRVINKKLVILR